MHGINKIEIDAALDINFRLWQQDWFTCFVSDILKEFFALRYPGAEYHQIFATMYYHYLKVNGLITRYEQDAN